MATRCASVARGNPYVQALREAVTRSIPDTEVNLRGIKFPKNFKDLTRDRLRMNAMMEPKKAPQTLAIESKLNDPVSLNMDKQPLQEAIDFLRNYTGMNIVLDPKALNDENITSATPVTLAANNIRLKTALKLLLNPLGLTYKIEDEVLLITSPQASMSSTISRPYYVGDLVLPMQHIGNPAAGLKNPTNPAFPSLTNPGQNPAQAVEGDGAGDSVQGCAARADADASRSGGRDSPAKHADPLQDDDAAGGQDCAT